MVVTPDVAVHGDDMGAEEAYGEDESYDDYGQYGSESGDMSYGEGGQMMDPSLAVAGPSGAADGNKGKESPFYQSMGEFQNVKMCL